MVFSPLVNRIFMDTYFMGAFVEGFALAHFLDYEFTVLGIVFSGLALTAL